MTTMFSFSFFLMLMMLVLMLCCCSSATNALLSFTYDPPESQRLVRLRGEYADSSFNIVNFLDSAADDDFIYMLGGKDPATVARFNRTSLKYKDFMLFDNGVASQTWLHVHGDVGYVGRYVSGTNNVVMFDVRTFKKLSTTLSFMQFPRGVTSDGTKYMYVGYWSGGGPGRLSRLEYATRAITSTNFAANEYKTYSLCINDVKTKVYAVNVGQGAGQGTLVEVSLATWSKSASVNIPREEPRTVVFIGSSPSSETGCVIIGTHAMNLMKFAVTSKVLEYMQDAGVSFSVYQGANAFTNLLKFGSDSILFGTNTKPSLVYRVAVDVNETDGAEMYFGNVLTNITFDGAENDTSTVVRTGNDTVVFGLRTPGNEKSPAHQAGRIVEVGPPHEHEKQSPPFQLVADTLSENENIFYTCGRVDDKGEFLYVGGVERLGSLSNPNRKQRLVRKFWARTLKLYKGGGNNKAILEANEQDPSAILLTRDTAYVLTVNSPPIIVKIQLGLMGRTGAVATTTELTNNDQAFCMVASNRILYIGTFSSSASVQTSAVLKVTIGDDTLAKVNLATGERLITVMMLSPGTSRFLYVGLRMIPPSEDAAKPEVAGKLVRYMVAFFTMSGGAPMNALTLPGNDKPGNSLFSAQDDMTCYLSSYRGNKLFKVRNVDFVIAQTLHFSSAEYGTQNDPKDGPGSFYGTLLEWNAQIAVLGFQGSNTSGFVRVWLDDFTLIDTQSWWRNQKTNESEYMRSLKYVASLNDSAVMVFGDQARGRLAKIAPLQETTTTTSTTTTTAASPTSTTTTIPGDIDIQYMDHFIAPETSSPSGEALLGFESGFFYENKINGGDAAAYFACSGYSTQTAFTQPILKLPHISSHDIPLGSAGYKLTEEDGISMFGVSIRVGHFGFFFGTSRLPYARHRRMALKVDLDKNEVVIMLNETRTVAQGGGIAARTGVADKQKFLLIGTQNYPARIHRFWQSNLTERDDLKTPGIYLKSLYASVVVQNFAIFAGKAVSNISLIKINLDTFSMVEMVQVPEPTAGVDQLFAWKSDFVIFSLGSLQPYRIVKYRVSDMTLVSSYSHDAASPILVEYLKAGVLVQNRGNAMVQQAPAIYFAVWATFPFTVIKFDPEAMREVGRTKSSAEQQCGSITTMLWDGGDYLIFASGSSKRCIVRFNFTDATTPAPQTSTTGTTTTTTTTATTTTTGHITIANETTTTSAAVSTTSHGGGGGGEDNTTATTTTTTSTFMSETTTSPANNTEINVTSENPAAAAATFTAFDGELSRAAADGTSGTALVFAGGAGVLGAPGAAMTASRALALPGLATCSGRTADGILWARAPVYFPNSFFPGVGLGEDSGFYFRGGILSFFVVALTIAAITAVLTVFFAPKTTTSQSNSDKKSSSSGNNTMDQAEADKVKLGARVRMYLARVAMLLFAQTVAPIGEAIGVLLSSEEVAGGDVAAALVPLLVVVVVCCLVTYKIHQATTVTKTKGDEKSTTPSTSASSKQRQDNKNKQVVAAPALEYMPSEARAAGDGDDQSQNVSASRIVFANSPIAQFCFFGARSWTNTASVSATWVWVRRLHGTQQQIANDGTSNNSNKKKKKTASSTSTSSFQDVLRSKFARHTIIISAVFALLVGVLTGIAKASPAKCKNMLAIIAVANSLMLVYDVAVLPMIVPLANVLTTALDAVTALCSVLIAAKLGSVESARQNPGLMSFVSVGLRVVALIITVGLMCIVVFRILFLRLSGIEMQPIVTSTAATAQEGDGDEKKKNKKKKRESSSSATTTAAVASSEVDNVEDNKSNNVKNKKEKQSSKTRDQSSSPSPATSGGGNNKRWASGTTAKKVTTMRDVEHEFNQRLLQSYGDDDDGGGSDNIELVPVVVMSPSSRSSFPAHSASSRSLLSPAAGAAGAAPAAVSTRHHGSARPSSPPRNSQPQEKQKSEKKMDVLTTKKQVTPPPPPPQPQTSFSPTRTSSAKPRQRHGGEDEMRHVQQSRDDQTRRSQQQEQQRNNEGKHRGRSALVDDERPRSHRPVADNHYQQHPSPSRTTRRTDSSPSADVRRTASSSDRNLSRMSSSPSSSSPRSPSRSRRHDDVAPRDYYNEERTTRHRSGRRDDKNNNNNSTDRNRYRQEEEIDDYFYRRDGGSNDRSQRHRSGSGRHHHREEERSRDHQRGASGMQEPRQYEEGRRTSSSSGRHRTDREQQQRGGR